MQGSTSDAEAHAPHAVFDHLTTAAYVALGIEDPPVDFTAWMMAAEAAWIITAGAR